MIHGWEHQHQCAAVGYGLVQLKFNVEGTEKQVKGENDLSKVTTVAKNIRP